MKDFEKPLQNEVKSGIIDPENTKKLEELEKFAKEKWGVQNINLNVLDYEAVKGTFETMDKEIEFWKLQDKIHSIGQSEGGMISTRFSNDGTQIIVDFNPVYFNDISNVKSVYDNGVLLNVYPANTTWKNIGVHETTHIVHGIVSAKNATDPLLARDDFLNHDTTRTIVNEAWKNKRNKYPKGTRLVDARQQISGFATDSLGNLSETVAEARSDVFLTVTPHNHLA